MNSALQAVARTIPVPTGWRYVLANAVTEGGEA